ncbi:MAG: DNA double-strand break repair nuclease NurA [Candidatus Bathyarchaeia archaeon]
MIEQHSIAITPKYNFPHLTMDTALPQKLVEQCIITLKHVQKHPFQLNQQDFQQTDNMNPQHIRLKPQPINLKPNPASIVIAGCDTSTMKIGETSTGILVAIRGANVWKQDKKYHYHRLGPFIFHITEENKREVYSTLEKTYFPAAREQSNHSFLTLPQMPMRIAALLEKWLQLTLAKTITNGIILFDGSLTAGTPDNPISHAKEILSNATERGNIILAFSKMTSLRVNNYLVTDLSADCKPPCLLETSGLRSKPPIVLLGDVYVAKLAYGKYAFRVDVSKDVPLGVRLEAFEKLLGNDALVQGYPETLRLAHVLCTFTANEVIAMQHFAVHKFRLKIINRPDMHRVLFGMFGGGDYYS